MFRFIPISALAIMKWRPKTPNISNWSRGVYTPSLLFTSVNIWTYKENDAITLRSSCVNKIEGIFRCWTWLDNVWGPENTRAWLGPMAQRPNERVPSPWENWAVRPMHLPKIKDVTAIICLYSLIASTAGCSINSATGNSDFIVLSKAREDQIGKDEHPKIIKQL